MTDIDKAREWADRWSEDDPLILADAKAAIKLIKELPDQWVDVEKVREIIEEMDDCLNMESTTDFSMGIDNATANWRNALKALITMKLPTLADMTQEEQAECQWMQCRVTAFSEDERLVIAYVDDHVVTLWREDGHVVGTSHELITPLPDLPKLQWPGSAPDDVAYATGGVLTTQDVVDECRAVRKERALPHPEDVPANEPWLIEVDNEKAIGTRYVGNTVVPWSVAALDGSFAGDFHDNEVTLIHKLVPETHALPEGMRLADHEEYGRVVVAPRASTHGEEYFYRLEEDIAWGASHGYRPTEEFTFLDGDQHV